jgi:hypothetical protein
MRTIRTGDTVLIKPDLVTDVLIILSPVWLSSLKTYTKRRIKCFFILTQRSATGIGYVWRLAVGD